MKQYDLEYIDKLRIHELRDLARTLRISSPTTLKKEELIGKIMAVVDEKDNSENKYIKKSGELDFYQLLLSDNLKLLESLLEDNSNTNEEKIEKPKEHSTIVLKSNQNTNFDDDTPYGQIHKIYSFGVGQNLSVFGVDEQEEIVSGYIDIHSSGYGILRNGGYVPSDKDSYLPISIIKKYNLRKGNFIEAKAKYIISGDPKVVYEVTSIDGSPKSKSLKPFDEYSYNGLGEKFKTKKFGLALLRGQRQYIESMPIEDCLFLAKDLILENGIDIKFANLKARPEENFSTIDHMEIVNIPFNKNANEVVDAINLLVERARLEFEQGKSQIIILYNFSELIRQFDVAFEGCVDYSKYNASAINKISNILYNAKFSDKKQNISILCVDRAGIPTDLKKLMEVEFLPLFNRVYSEITIHSEK